MERSLAKKRPVERYATAERSLAIKRPVERYATVNVPLPAGKLPSFKH